MVAGKTCSQLFVGLFSAVGLILLVLPAAWGAVIRVPEDFPHIQAAIDAASDGDAVILADETYSGPENRDLDFKGKAITVASENGPENCIIDCEGAGRGAYFHSGETAASVLSGVTIINGLADEGGGIYCASAPLITHCRLIGNTARNSGGGIFFTGDTATLSNCIIAANSATWGGGVFCSEGAPTLTNCTMTANSGRGKLGISSSSSQTLPTIINTILWEASDIFHFTGFAYALPLDHCLVKGIEVSGATIIHFDPLFTDPSGAFPLEWDLRLLPGSPAIDAGGNDTDGIPATDLDGAPRRVDGDGDGRPTVDMGAQEFQNPAQTQLRGRLTLPEEAEGAPFRVLVDDDTAPDNGWIAAAKGTCGPGALVDYALANVPAGTYYVYAQVHISGKDGSLQDGDYLGFFGTDGPPPERANAVVPFSGTVIYDITLGVMGTGDDGQRGEDDGGSGGGGGCFLSAAKISAR